MIIMREYDFFHYFYLLKIVFYGRVERENYITPLTPLIRGDIIICPK